MATDYRFAMKCWQDSAGSEDAKINIFVDGTQVATDVVITATSDSSPQIVSFEATGLPDPVSSGSIPTCDIKVVLTNEYFVDANTDRNVWINGIAYIVKKDDEYGGLVTDLLTTESHFTTEAEYVWFGDIPTEVVGDQIPDSFWDDALASNSGSGSFYYIPVFGNPNDNTQGVTITWQLKDF